MRGYVLPKLISIILLFAMSFSCFSRLCVIAGYELNKSYIARVLCVNRDKPAMHCNGKCYLRKKLQQDQQRKNNENSTIGNKLDIVLFCADEQTLFFPELQSSSFVFSTVKSHYYSSPSFGFFHPPRA